MLIENHEFNEIYEKYKNLVLKVAYQVIGDLQAAEEYAGYIFDFIQRTGNGISEYKSMALPESKASRTQL